MFNNFKLVLLIVSLSALMMFVGNAIGGQSGLIFALAISLVSQGIAFWNSDKIALAMNQAEELTPQSSPELYSLLKKLATKAELPTPKLYITPERLPNAFATGRDPEHSAVAVTAGLLEHLSQDEIEGVLAHELGHIKNRDVFISTVAAVMAGAISSLAQFAFLFGGHRNNDQEGSSSPITLILTMLLAPIAAMLIQMAISRSREFGADQTAAEITGKPQALASALRRLESVAKESKYMPENLNPAFSSLYITNPFHGDFFMEMMSTHPPIKKRIDRLNELR